MNFKAALYAVSKAKVTRFPALDRLLTSRLETSASRLK